MTGVCAAENASAELSPSAKWEHPPSFYCPISQQCMHDPVVLCDGHTYERRHIERWLEQRGTSPVSGLQLSQKDIFPNHALRNAIEEYFQQVFSAHRRAIRKNMVCNEPGQQLNGMDSNTSLLRTIDTLMQCSLLMNADLSLECVLRQIMDEVKRLVGADVASVFLVDTQRQELYSTVNSTNIEIRIPVNAGIAGHVATTGESVIIKDTYGDRRFTKVVDAKTGFKTRNMMCVPLRSKKGDVMGVVQLINKTGVNTDGLPLTFSQDDLQFLQVFACQAATALQNTRSFEDDVPFSAPSSEEHENGQAEHAADDVSKPLLGVVEDECDLDKEKNKLLASTTENEWNRADSKSSCSSMVSAECWKSSISHGALWADVFDDSDDVEGIVAVAAPDNIGVAGEDDTCDHDDGLDEAEDAPRSTVIGGDSGSDDKSMRPKAQSTLNSYMLDWLTLVNESDLKEQLASFLLKIEQAQSELNAIHGFAIHAMTPPLGADVESFEGVASFCAGLVYDLLLSMSGRSQTPAWTDVSQADQENDGTPMSRTSSLDSANGKKKSGRSRQRAARYWSTVRCRTPSPSPTLATTSPHEQTCF
jgi:hypothetical protein